MSPLSLLLIISYLLVLNVFIFEALHEECDVTQFNQLNLNSSFSIWLLINWLICWFIWRQLLRAGLLYNIKIIEDTVEEHHEELSNVFSSKVFFVFMVQAEFFLVNCPLSSLYPVNCPCQMPSYEFKNHSRNVKYFLLKGNLDSRSNLCNIQKSNFCNSTTKWHA